MGGPNYVSVPDEGQEGKNEEVTTSTETTIEETSSETQNEGE